jgi:hypothetical protein
MLTGWPALPKHSFINQRFGWLHMDHDTSIKLGDGGRSNEKKPKIWEVWVGQRRRNAMLSVQSEAIN